MIIANSPRWLTIISYPTRARGIIVNYTMVAKPIKSLELNYTMIQFPIIIIFILFVFTGTEIQPFVFSTGPVPDDHICV